MTGSGTALFWPRKFAAAFGGLFWALRNETSFRIHLPVSITVLAVAAVLQVELWRWVALVLAITLVVTAELLNSALEQIIKVLHPQHDQQIGRALDIAAAGVLIASIGAVIIGLLTLGRPLWMAVTTTMG